jgi:hypothetical protein
MVRVNAYRKAHVHDWFSNSYKRKTPHRQLDTLSLQWGSFRSKTSRISSAKIEERQKRAELKAKSTNMSRRRLKIEQAKLELKFEEEELEIDTQLKVSDAREKVLNEIESEDHASNSAELDPDVSEWFPHANNYSENSVQPTGNYIVSDIPRDETHVSDRPRGETHVSDRPYEYTHIASDRSHEHTPGIDASEGFLLVARELKKPTPDIQKFSGDVLEYKSFMRQFEARICANTNSYDERLTYLLQFTTGEAHTIAQGYSHLSSEIGYKAVLEELENRYGDPTVVAQTYINKALNWPLIKGDDSKSLDKFAIFLRECMFAVEEVGAVQVLEYAENLKCLVMKLPFYLHDKWRNIVYETKAKGRSVKFNQLVDFVRKEAKKQNDPTFGRDVMNINTQYTCRSTRDQHSRGVKPTGFRKNCSTSVTERVNPDYAGPSNYGSAKGSQSADSANALSFIRPCLYCQDNSHTLQCCRNITEKCLKERYDFLKGKGLCYGCLKSGHHREYCRQRLTCNICSKLHPSVLHVEPHRPHVEPQRYQVSNRNVGAGQNNVSNGSVSMAVSPKGDKGAGNHQALPIVPVRVKHKSSDKYIETYAFLDSGSTATLCTEKLMNTLNVEGRKTHISLHTLGQDSRAECFEITRLDMSDLNGDNLTALPPVFTQRELPVTSSDIVYPRDLQNWSYLKDLPLQRINSGVDLLIGVNVPDALQPWDVVPSMENGPFAVMTAFGWVVNGPLDVIRISEGSGTCMFVSVNRIEATVAPSLEDQLLSQFNYDFSERIVDDVEEPSREDRQFLENVERSVKFEDGHYVIDLPFRDPNLIMPNNRKQAEHRLILLGKRLEKDDNFYQEYQNFMNKILEQGYARKVCSDDLSSDEGRSWYLPHHGVYHPQKNKLRVVFDCAARYRGTSLNDNLLQGPNLTNSLIGTLLRFRQENIAIMGDIESMFHQVRVPSEHAGFLKFLWWEDSDLSKPVTEYQMAVHLFGATSSPSVCNYALRKAALDVKGHFDKEVIDTVLRHFYVDDCLKSV